MGKNYFTTVAWELIYFWEFQKGYCNPKILLKKGRSIDPIDRPRLLHVKADLNKPSLPMNPLNLPVFILFFAIVYLSIVYGLLKMAEAQKRTSTTVSPNPNDSNQRIEAP